MRCTEGRKVYWRIGYGRGSDGCAYGGGSIFKTKKAAMAEWGPMPAPMRDPNYAAPWA